jgi:outer membrane protein insertion porin family
MYLSVLKNTPRCGYIFPLFLLCLILSSCNITKKAPAGRPYLAKNSFEIRGGRFTRLEREALEAKMANQLDDSSKLNTSTRFMFINILKSPPAYDTAFSNRSAENMKSSMYHIGYYNSNVTYNADTVGQKVKVHYVVKANNPTIIDTFSYRLFVPDLQQIAQKYRDASLLEIGKPVTKGAVLGEINRVVDTFRNNGYYKFSAAELRMRGDTTIASLTTVSDDPIEQLRLLAEAQQKRDSPEIKLNMVLNQPEDSTRLQQYRVGKIFILMDYFPGDDINDTVNITQRTTRSFVLRYHKPIFRTGFIARKITLRPGQLFNYSEYNRTLANISKANSWQSVNIVIKERPDSSQVDLVLELIPVKKFGFEASVEASYSAVTNTSSALAGNLIGFSGNLSLENRNIGREAIRMTHRLRAGVELNNNARANNTSLINSNELGYSNSIVYPRLVPVNPFKKPGRVTRPGESFLNFGVSQNNRLNLFSMQNVNLNIGSSRTGIKGILKDWKKNWKPINLEWSYLYNRTDSFKTILDSNLFLKFSYNSAFLFGTAGGLARTFRSSNNTRSLSKESAVTLNYEESVGWATLIRVLNKYKNKFVKFDGEYKHSINYLKSAMVFRSFVGVGIPMSSKDTTLPFFKQFYGGGSNSMRGWPIRGIGPGGKELVPYTSEVFNDRRGDIQIEVNAEYRYDIARLIPNLLTLRGAFFADIGNVWNMRRTNPAGVPDSAQFKFSKLYEQMGMSVGTGFRLDFNYVVVRMDFGFRVKRPETSYINDGWKFPDFGDNFLKKLFSRGEEYRRWRYENFNFSVGIGLPF